MTAPAITTAQSERRKEPFFRSRSFRKGVVITLFLLPSAVPLFMFSLFPMFSSLWTSLHSWNLLSPMEWVGIGNYKALLNDPSVWRAFGNTLYYIVGYLPIVYVGGLTIALALNRAMRGRNLIRGAYFLPVVASWIVVALMWRWLLNPSVGVVNYLLGLIGIDGPGWWTDPMWSMPSVILASAWKDLGFVMVLLLAGLQAIPEDFYEASELDGANAWQRFRYITFPLLTPSTFFVIVISLINGFQVFDQVYAMTDGGPAGSSTVVMLQIYDMTFRYGEAGKASALSWLLFICILVVTVVQVRGQKRWVHYA